MQYSKERLTSLLNTPVSAKVNLETSPKENRNTAIHQNLSSKNAKMLAT